jgi:dipeptidase D
MRKHFLPLLCSLSLVAAAAGAANDPPSELATQAARHALATYQTELVASLSRMVAFNTVATSKVAFEANPQFLGFKKVIQDEAKRLGFDFTDHGYVLVVGLGQGAERLGIITHGDVQPVDPSKWAKSPFELDSTTEPGRLLGRGTEDDKGPIATALYAMKAIKDQAVPLKKRIELYIYLAEESDWKHLEEFLKTHQAPGMNITLDSEYPVVTAEKGYSTVSVTFPRQSAPLPADKPFVAEFAGGFFGSQIPEDAKATIAHATPALEAQIRARGAQQKGMRYEFAWQQDSLRITAHGVSAHSSKPEAGVNAIAMLADALAVTRWPATTAGALVNFSNDLIGTGLYAEKFGSIAYSDAFMGPMTFAPTVLRQQADGGIQLNINARRPQGKSAQQLRDEINAALTAWQARTDGAVRLADIKPVISDAWVQKSAPQVDTLLGVYAHYTGAKDAKPVAIGGSTNSRLFPHAVSFGPGMPGEVYTGHSEHEFITTQQLLLNLQMYTAVMVELAR